MNSKKKNLVIFGSNGFIGKNLKENQNKNYNYNFFDRNKIDLSKKINKKIIKNEIKKNSIFILLAFKTKHLGERNANINENITLIINFIEIIKMAKPSKVIFFSSVSVYGDKKNFMNYDENSNVNPDNDYGIAKVISENILEYYKKILYYDLLIIRIPKVFGKFDYNNNYGPSSFLNNIKLNKKLKLWGKGEERKHFLYIKDLIDILHLLIIKNSKGKFIVAPDKGISFFMLAELCIKKCNSNLKIMFKKRTFVGSNHLLNNKKIKKQLPTFEFTNFNNSIVDYFKIINNK